jgi:hypothetical protein
MLMHAFVSKFLEAVGVWSCGSLDRAAAVLRAREGWPASSAHTHIAKAEYLTIVATIV